jgi:transcriptional regulator with XRE-family HTH domain
MKQRQVAELVNLSQPYFAQIERGERRLNTELQEQIAAALGVRPGDLVDFEAPKPEDEQLLLDTFRDLSPEWREGVLALLQAVSRRRGKDSEGT